MSAVHSKYFGEPLSQHAEYFMPHDKVRTVIEDVKQYPQVKVELDEAGVSHFFDWQR